MHAARTYMIQMGKHAWSGANDSITIAIVLRFGVAGG